MLLELERLTLSFLVLYPIGATPTLSPVLAPMKDHCLTRRNLSPYLFGLGPDLAVRRLKSLSFLNLSFSFPNIVISLANLGSYKHDLSIEGRHNTPIRLDIKGNLHLFRPVI